MATDNAHSHNAVAGHHTSGHDEHPFDYDKAFSTYKKVGMVLIAGTIITWLVAYYINTGIVWLDIAIGLMIAAIKVSFVCLIFMHLNHERGLIYKTLVFTMIFFSAMMFLMCLAYSDPISHALRAD